MSACQVAGNFKYLHNCLVGTSGSILGKRGILLRSLRTPGPHGSIKCWPARTGATCPCQATTRGENADEMMRPVKALRPGMEFFGALCQNSWSGMAVRVG